MAFDWGSGLVGFATLVGAAKGGSGKSSSKTDGSSESLQFTDTNQLEQLEQELKKMTRNYSGSETDTTTTNKSTSNSTNTSNSTSASNSLTQNLSEEQTRQLSETTGLNFDARVVAQLQNLLSGTIAGTNTGGTQAALSEQLNRIRAAGGQQIDAQAYADSVAAQADARLSGDLEGNINNLMSNVGGSTDGNSMAALLANRMRSDTTAEVSGIRSAALAQGLDMNRAQNESVSGQIAALTDAQTSSLSSLIQAISGAQTSTTGQQTGTASTLGQQQTTQQQIDKTKSTNKTTATDKSKTSTTTDAYDLTRESAKMSQTTDTLISQLQAILTEETSKTKNKNGSTTASLTDRLNEVLTGSKKAA